MKKNENRLNNGFVNVSIRKKFIQIMKNTSMLGKVKKVWIFKMEAQTLARVF
eukprot:UN25669